MRDIIISIIMFISWMVLLCDNIHSSNLFVQIVCIIFIALSIAFTIFNIITKDSINNIKYRRL